MFHDRPTCARSRSRCSRPERGQPKVPFSRGRCHILVIDYRRGSIGSNETATATTGGPRVIDVFDGNGAPSGPNYLLFSDADRLVYSLRDRSGIGWSPRPHTPVLGALWIENSGDWYWRSAHCWGPVLICIHRWKRPRMRRRRLYTTSSDPERPLGSLRAKN